MKKMILTFISMFLVIACLFSGCSSNEINIPAVKNKDIKVPPFDKQNIDIDFDKSTNCFKITDKRSGKVWSNDMTDEYYGMEVINLALKRTKEQLFTISYGDASNDIIAVKSTDEEVTIKSSKEKEKIVVHCLINDTEIEFKMELSVKGNTLIVKVPNESIVEGDNKIISIEVLPFLGASIDTEDGYIFYPDGCGALYEFSESNAGSTFPYRSQIFGNYFTDLDELIDGLSTGEKWPMVPVFGVKQKDSGFVGVVTKGQSETALTLAPSGYIFRAARVYPIFTYRFSHSMKAINEEEVIVFEKDRYKDDFEVQYTFLNDKNANYSGMARTYQNYLFENKLLNKSEYSPSVSLNMLGLIKKPMFLWEEDVVVSKLSYGKEIIRMLKENKISNVKLNVLGWQKSGYGRYPAHFPVSSSIGGESDLKELSSNLKSNNSKLFLNDNFYEAIEGVKGYSKRDDIIKNISNEIVTTEEKNQYLMDFRKIYGDMTGNWSKQMQRLSLGGVNIDNIGRLIYANGATNHSFRRSQAVNVADNLGKVTNENFEIFSSAGANEYILKSADFIYSLPENSSGNFVFTRDVPFIQIVLHGNINYTPEIPGNLSDNYENTVLKWIEYGYTPFYSIAQKDSSILKDAYSENIFISKFTDWHDRITKTVLEFEENLNNIKRDKIFSHEVLDNDLIEVVYESGNKIVINSTNEPLEYNEMKIDSKEYLVI